MRKRSASFESRGSLTQSGQRAGNRVDHHPATGVVAVELDQRQGGLGTSEGLRPLPMRGQRMAQKQVR